MPCLDYTTLKAGALPGCTIRDSLIVVWCLGLFTLQDLSATGAFTLRFPVPKLFLHSLYQLFSAGPVIVCVAAVTATTSFHL